MKSRFHGAGYLLSDNRASDWGTKDEDDLLGCGHCGASIRRHGHTDVHGYHPGWIEEGGMCCICDQPLCGPECNDCRAKVALPLDQGGGCNHQERQLERALHDAHRREQNAKLL
jgi:hypothetical protein